MKEGVWKVNWAQRGLRETTDLRDHPKIFLQVKDLLEDLMRFAHDNVSVLGAIILLNMSDLNCRSNTIFLDLMQKSRFWLRSSL
jgi:hypothetical protein